MKKLRTLIVLFLLLSLIPLASATAQTPTQNTAATESVFSRIREVLSGTYKILTSFSKTRETREGFYAALQRLRLEFKPKITKNLELNLTYDHELLLNDFSHTSDFSLVRQKNQHKLNFWNTTQIISDTDHLYERHLLYRAYLKADFAHSRWTLGKQLIDWGRMRFYSPLDIFNPPLASDLEPEERVGFDALNVELFPTEFSGLNLVYGPGRTNRQNSFGGRLYKKINTWDTFFMAAKHEEEYVAGAGVDGYWHDAGVRAEFSYAKDGKEKYPRAAIGFDYNFPNKTYLIVEYAYNGAANGDSDAFLNSLTESRRRLSIEKNLLSLLVSHDLTPLLKLKISVILDTQKMSAFFNPEVRYNIRKDADVACGAQVFARRPHSEFGAYQNLYYIELKFFF